MTRPLVVLCLGGC